jgi:5'-nucleotidase
MHDPNIARLTILHTNDVHSRVEAFPMDGGRNAGQGGASRRASLIKKIRSREEHILLLDAGDIFQGTPYFNYFGGEIEMKLMSEMGYDAATIGNHDFDGGIDGLEKQLKHANFDMLIANYDFSNTVMKGKTKEYRIWQKGEIKVGVLGVGIALNSLVPKALYKDTVYSDPISNANRIANILKNDEKCDLVICLSHMGYNYKSEKPCDTKLATNSKDIDIIIGGHTHTFMDEPDVRKNLNGEEVIINQVGWAGLMLGRLEVLIEKGKNKKCITCRNSYIR